MRRGIALLAAAALAVAAGCSTDSTDAAPQAAPPSPAAAASSKKPDAKPPVTPAVLKFAGKTLDGKGYDTAQLAGKPAILWFWAPWCATCASQAMSISDIAEEYGDRLGILGVAGMGGNKAMHEFVADLEVGSVPHLDDEAGVLWKRFKITEQSTYVLVSRDGEVVKKGYLDDLQLTSEVKSLVA